MSAEGIGLWLIGVGSFLVVGAALGLTPDRAGGRFAGKYSSLMERLFYATQVTGLLFAGVGSLTIATSQSIAGSVLVATGIAALLSYDGLLAWLQKRYRDEQLENAERFVAGGDTAKRQQLAIAQRCATWRWCLRHPLNMQPWPGLEEERPG
jgi:hypothetical protein